MIKSMLSELVRAEAKVIVEPLTVNESCGACITPLSETSRWFALAGEYAPPFNSRLYVAVADAVIASNLEYAPVIGCCPMNGILLFPNLVHTI